MSSEISRAHGDLVRSVCCNCGKVFRGTPRVLEPLCDSCKRYFLRQVMGQNPANELAIQVATTHMRETIRNTR